MTADKAPSHYIRSKPSPQNAVDIFKGEWSSSFPESFGVQTTGEADLFEDQRIVWAEESGVHFRDKRVLELGPLEAGHTWMMDQRGVQEILAIEAHERAYLKCLIVKEIAPISSARFIHGNFDKFLEENQTSFDICLASGVLYHSSHPTQLLDRICKCCRTIILWTHYYDQEAISTHGPGLFARFGDPIRIQYQGSEIWHHPFNYQEEATADAFCGGLESNSLWLEREGIEFILSKNEFKIIATGFEHPHHPNGPAYALIAERSM